MSAKTVLRKQAEPEVIDLVGKCMFTRDRRKALYDIYRNFYYQGGADVESDVNRIYGDVNSTLSLIYSPEHLILEGVPVKQMDPDDPAEEAERVILDEIAKLVGNNFFHRRLDLKTSKITLSALIDGTAPVRAMWRDGGVDYIQCLPEQFGVAYEGLDLDDENQVFCFETELTESEVKRRYPEFARKIVTLGETGDAKAGSLKVFLGGGQGSNEANVQPLAVFDFKPQTAMKTYTAYGLYQFDHDEKQWRVTILVNNVAVKDYLTGSSTHNWFLIKPLEIPGNIWGLSLIQLLKGIQTKRDDFLAQLNHAIEKSINPPLVATGHNIGSESLSDKAKDLDRPGGTMTFDAMSGKIEPWLPKLDIQAGFEVLGYYDAQSKFIMGKNEVLSGESQKNVRGQGYASLLAQFASTDLKRVAHTLEAQFEEIFTYTGILFQINDDTTYKRNGRTFTLAQWSQSYRVEIYAHTGSPITTENNIQLTLSLHKEGIIPPDVLTEILPLPYKNKILEYIKKKEKAAQAEKQRQEALEAEAAKQGKFLKAGKTK